MANRVSGIGFAKDETFNPDKMGEVVRRTSQDLEDLQSSLEESQKETSVFRDLGIITSTDSIATADYRDGTILCYEIEGEDKVSIILNHRLIPLK